MAQAISYRLDSAPIGRGGYALVYRGVHRETGEVAAVKRPRRGDPIAEQRFRREVEVQRQLDHPNIMPILDFSIEKHWLAMPLAEHSLTKFVEANGPVDGYQLVGLIRQLAAGLDYAHGRDFVHRDVNPNNVLELIDASGRSVWVVGDWGLVGKPYGPDSPRLTRREVPMGTAGFTAPEAEANPLDATRDCDVFSLARVAHYALTGVWPRESFPMPPPGWFWDDFVTACTNERAKRPKDIREALRLLRRMDATLRRMHDEAEGLICPRCKSPVTGGRCEQCGRVWD